MIVFIFTLAMKGATLQNGIPNLLYPSRDADPVGLLQCTYLTAIWSNSWIIKGWFPWFLSPSLSLTLVKRII